MLNRARQNPPTCGCEGRSTLNGVTLHPSHSTWNFVGAGKTVNKQDQLARYYSHLSTLILTCFDISEPIFQSAEPLGAAVGGFHTASSPSLTYFLLHFSPAPTRNSRIHRVTSVFAPCQVEPSIQGLNRERGGSENTQPQRDKRTPPPPPTHPLPYPFGLTQSSVMQDPRIQSLR